MSVFFEEWQEGKGSVGPVLMNVSQTWGERFVRLSEFVSREYKHSSVFFFEGQITNDTIYVNVPELQALFRAVAQVADRLFLPWAEYAGGMIEVATQTLLHNAWSNPKDVFLPIRCGVSPKDIPAYGEKRVYKHTKEGKDSMLT
jgi:hypothetical protein